MPESSLPSLEFLHDCSPSYRSLINWLAPKIDDNLLLEIARADYGQDVEGHFEALLRIRDNVDLDEPIRWKPLEVLNLTRWTEPEDTSRYPDSDSRHAAHLMRVFCCATLLVAGGEPESQPYLLSENETLIQLCLSIFALDVEAAAHAASLLAWRLLEPSYDDAELPFFGVAMLLLQLRLYPNSLSSSGLASLCAWILTAETHARHSKGCCLPISNEPWLLGLVIHDMRHSAWEHAARVHLLHPPNALPTSLADQVRDLGAKILCHAA